MESKVQLVKYVNQCLYVDRKLEMFRVSVLNHQQLDAFCDRAYSKNTILSPNS